MGVLHSVRATEAPGSAILVRLIVGGTFLSEGIQKFLFPVTPILEFRLTAIVNDRTARVESSTTQGGQ